MKRSTLLIVLLLVALLAFPFYFSAASKDVSKVDPIASTSERGVSVHLISYRIQDSTMTVTSCLDLPDTQDWIVYASLESGSIKLNADSMAVVNPKDPETYRSSYRCYEFGFAKGMDPANQAVTFVVDKVSTSLPESIDQAMCDQARTEIQQARPGVSFECIIDPHGVAFENRSEPGTISDEELVQLISDTLTDTVVGPWALALKP